MKIINLLHVFGLFDPKFETSLQFIIIKCFTFFKNLSKISYVIYIFYAAFIHFDQLFIFNRVKKMHEKTKNRKWEMLKVQLFEMRQSSKFLSATNLNSELSYHQPAIPRNDKKMILKFNYEYIFYLCNSIGKNYHQKTILSRCRSDQNIRSSLSARLIESITSREYFLVFFSNK